MFINLFIIYDTAYTLNGSVKVPINIDNILYISPYGTDNENSRLVYSENHYIVVEETVIEIYDLIERSKNANSK